MHTQYHSLLAQHGVLFSRIPDNEVSVDAILHKFKHCGYHDFDIFTSHPPLPADLHYHIATEFRVIVEGEGVYIIIVDSQMCVVPVSAGDCITIPYFVEHAFSSESPVKAVRYFDDADYTAWHTPHF
jgi:mannose-6-phosphate isomerase-like protein (cupin superfamily)